MREESKFSVETNSEVKNKKNKKKEEKELLGLKFLEIALFRRPLEEKKAATIASGMI